MPGKLPAFLILAGAGLCVQPVRAQAPLPPLGEMEAAVRELVPSGLLQDAIRCRLQHALWGGYDMRVYLGRSTDGVPRILQVLSGRFVNEEDPAPLADLPTHFERAGRLESSDSLDLFARGVPYFIAAAAIQGDVLHITYQSNPVKPTDKALALAVIDEADDVSNVLFSTAPVASGPGIQKVTLQDGRFAMAERVRVAILLGGPSDISVGCILSNELDAVPN
jgi:hypothetical protein